MKNYRPISNLSFISKISEKVVAQRIKNHIQGSDTCNPFQSVYRKFHSTETALLKICNDVLSQMDKIKVTTLFGFSTAVDSVVGTNFWELQYRPQLDCFMSH